MKSRSFKEWAGGRGARAVKPEDLTPEQQAQAERLARMAQPYANLSEAELLGRLKSMRGDPQVAAFLKAHPLDEVARQLAPALDESQKAKLASILRELGGPAR